MARATNDTASVLMRFGLSNEILPNLVPVTISRLERMAGARVEFLSSPPFEQYGEVSAAARRRPTSLHLVILRSCLCDPRGSEFFNRAIHSDEHPPRRQEGRRAHGDACGVRKHLGPLVECLHDKP